MTSSSHGGTVSREPSWLAEVHRQLPQRLRCIVDCVRERWSVLPGHASVLPGHTVLRSSCEVGRSQLATGSNCRRRHHIFRDRSDRQHDPRRQRSLVLPAVHHRLSRLDRHRDGLARAEFSPPTPTLTGSPTLSLRQHRRPSSERSCRRPIATASRDRRRWNDRSVAIVALQLRGQSSSSGRGD